MSDINDKTFKELAKAFDKAAKKTFTKRRLEKLSVNTAKQIRKRTRLGFGIDDSGDKVKQKRLKRLTSEKYIQKRKKSRLHSLTSPSKSNLTFTGQLLDSIKGDGGKFVSNPGLDPHSIRSFKASIFVELDDDRDDGMTNSEILVYQEDQGRVFFGVTDAERNGIAREIRKDFENNLEVELKKTGDI